MEGKIISGSLQFDVPSLISTKHHGSVVSIPVPYSGGPRFKFRPGDGYPD
jgi:hypothetical protein